MRKFLHICRNTWLSEDGAVTIDFVVLCGAAVGMSLAIGAALVPQIEVASESLSSEMNASTALDGQSNSQ